MPVRQLRGAKSHAAYRFRENALPSRSLADEAKTNSPAAAGSAVSGEVALFVRQLMEKISDRRRGRRICRIVCSVLSADGTAEQLRKLTAYDCNELNRSWAPLWGLNRGGALGLALDEPGMLGMRSAFGHSQLAGGRWQGL